MNNCLLLLLSANHLHAQHMVGDKITVQREFTDSAHDRAQFAAFLSAHHCPTYMLADVIEEDFRMETIPYLTGKAHTAVLQRKFDQFYRGTSFHQATLLQRHEDGRRDADMLFSALTNPALLNPWLDALWHAQTPLAGIYSVPQVSTPLIKDHPSNHLLLITWNKFSGLRETYFKNHQLQISRLTPVSRELSFQEIVEAELARTYQYLKSLSLLPAGQMLDVSIVAHSDDLIGLQSKLPRSNDMRYEFVDIANLAQQLNVKEPLIDSDASQLFLRQLSLTRPKSQYGNSQHTHFYTLWQLRRGFFWGAAALLIASLLWAGLSIVWQETPDETAVAATEQQTQQVQRQARAMQQALPSTQVAPADLRTGTLALQQLQHHSSAPQAFLTPLSLVMNRFANIQLDELAWQMNASAAVSENTQPDVAAQELTFKGQLNNFAGNYRAALDYLEQFQHALIAQGYATTITAKPLDVSPSSNLSDQGKSASPGLSFTLTLVWRPRL
ncbi:MAG: hypothetical protein PXX73_03545 [Sideroxydans sp.]|nr:hypothetical protein [Sideroxydans sp.]